MAVHPYWQATRVSIFLPRWVIILVYSQHDGLPVPSSLRTAVMPLAMTIAVTKEMRGAWNSIV